MIFDIVTKPHALAFALCCCELTSGCAVISNRVPKDLRGPQPIDPFADSPTIGQTVVWKKPAFLPPAADPITPDGSISTCGGQPGLLLHEWKDVGDGKMQLVRGTAAGSQFAGGDFWGTHQYRDWNILLVVNKDYETILAPANFVDAGWDDDPLADTLRSKNPNLEHLFELEWDSGYFPAQMAPRAGDETVVVGRWVFDCGHEAAPKPPLTSSGYRAEVHAPAILVSSHIDSTPTAVRGHFLVFAGSRGGPLDTIPLLFFLRLWTSHQNPLGGQQYAFSLRAPQDGWKIASCRATKGTPASGRRKIVSDLLQLDDGGKSLTFTLSAQDFKPTSRLENSTIIDVLWVPDASASAGATKCD